MTDQVHLLGAGLRADLLDRTEPLLRAVEGIVERRHLRREDPIAHRREHSAHVGEVLEPHLLAGPELPKPCEAVHEHDGLTRHLAWGRRRFWGAERRLRQRRYCEWSRANKRLREFQFFPHNYPLSRV